MHRDIEEAVCESVCCLCGCELASEFVWGDACEVTCAPVARMVWFFVWFSSSLYPSQPFRMIPLRVQPRPDRRP